MHPYKIFTTVLALFITLLINGQKSDKFTQPLYEFEKGLDLYNNHIYEAAYSAFSRAHENIGLILLLQKIVLTIWLLQQSKCKKKKANLCY